MGIVETQPDIFYVSASDIYTWTESRLYRLDLNGWRPGQAIRPEAVLRFPQPNRGLNGSCVVAPGIILLADSWAGLIWRVDLADAGGQARTRVWLEHDSMSYLPKLYYDRIQLPGINGLQYSPKRGYLYYSASAKQLFMRVKVDPVAFNPAGDVEVVGSGRFDDFWIDQDAGYAYLAGHTLNTIDRLTLEPGESTREILHVAGHPFNDELVGPSAGRWGRGREEYGRVAFLTTDGGTATPPPGGARPARVLKAEFEGDA
jgi:sugar lactone lactonase YvrE